MQDHKFSFCKHEYDNHIYLIGYYTYNGENRYKIYEPHISYKNITPLYMYHHTILINNKILEFYGRVVSARESSIILGVSVKWSHDFNNIISEYLIDDK